MDGIPTITEREFQLLARLIHQASGIHLTPAKKPLLVGRLTKRLRALGLDSFAQYYKLVKNDPVELTEMLNRISTNETRFFREPNQLDFLTGTILPWLEARALDGHRPRRLRAWSAACSTGEEPYTVAMLLLDRFDSTWDLSILATDISNRALEAGRAAVFPLERSADVPQKLLKRHMLRGTGDNARRMRAGPELRALVTFRRLNFRGDPYPEGPFDLIFCRNVLMYFDAPTRASIAEKLLDRLDPSGFLLMGHAESLNGVTTRGRPVFPTIYARAEAALEGFPHASRSRWRVDG